MENPLDIEYFIYLKLYEKINIVFFFTNYVRMRFSYILGINIACGR
jgi:hypothetical protein